MKLRTYYETTEAPNDTMVCEIEELGYRATQRNPACWITFLGNCKKEVAKIANPHLPTSEVPEVYLSEIDRQIQGHKARTGALEIRRLCEEIGLSDASFELAYGKIEELTPKRAAKIIKILRRRADECSIVYL